MKQKETVRVRQIFVLTNWISKFLGKNLIRPYAFHGRLFINIVHKPYQMFHIARESEAILDSVETYCAAHPDEYQQFLLEESEDDESGKD